MTQSRTLFVVSALLLLFCEAATTSEEGVRAFLTRAFALTNEELARIQEGQVVSRLMPVSDPREVATFGIVRVKITPEFYVQRLADIANFKRDAAVLQIGVFSNPPALQDVAALTLDDADLRSLRDCRVGRCGVQLSADAINRFRQEVDWRRADAAQHANSLMRQILVDYVAEYQRSGAAASMQYADQREILNLRQEFVSLAESDLGGWDRFPTLRGHLFAYPKAGTDETLDLVYWSKEKVGRRSVASITHLAISRGAPASPADYAVASKHIYGTHYFDASLGLTVLLGDPSASVPATYLAYVNRSRVDVFGGIFGKVARKIVTARARTTVSDQLVRLQRRLEREFTAPPLH